MRISKAIYSKPALARKSATNICVLAVKRAGRSGRALEWKKGKLRVCLEQRLLAQVGELGSCVIG